MNSSRPADETTRLFVHGRSGWGKTRWCRHWCRKRGLEMVDVLQECERMRIRLIPEDKRETFKGLAVQAEVLWCNEAEAEAPLAFLAESKPTRRAMWLDARQCSSALVEFAWKWAERWNVPTLLEGGLDELPPALGKWLQSNVAAPLEWREMAEPRANKWQVFCGRASRCSRCNSAS